MDDLANFVIASLLVSLRLVPTLGFAPPFTLLRIPPTVRLLLAMSLSAWLVAAFTEQTTAALAERSSMLLAVFSELSIGIALALAMQLAFAAILTTGRLIDLQAGFAFALFADPTNRTQLPLIGMIFAYCTGALFFATGGPTDLLAIWAASLTAAPVGSGLSPDALPALLAYVASVFAMGLGAGGLILLMLFLIDLSIAFMSRTLPQMNVLFLGFQVKTIATLVLLPFALATSAALFLRMVRFALDAMPGMV